MNNDCCEGPILGYKESKCWVCERSEQPGDHKGAEPPNLAALPACRAGRQLVLIQRKESDNFLTAKAPRPLVLSTGYLREVVGLGLT